MSNFGRVVLPEQFAIIHADAVDKFSANYTVTEILNIQDSWPGITVTCSTEVSRSIMVQINGEESICAKVQIVKFSTDVPIMEHRIFKLLAEKGQEMIYGPLSAASMLSHADVNFDALMERYNLASQEIDPATGNRILATMPVRPTPESLEASKRAIIGLTERLKAHFLKADALKKMETVTGMDFKALESFAGFDQIVSEIKDDFSENFVSDIRELHF